MKALKLADKLDKCTNFYGESSLWYDHEASDAVSAAADELRRLAEVNAELKENNQTKHQQIVGCADEVDRLRRVNAELLVALESVRPCVEQFAVGQELVFLDLAIAKAKEQQ